MATTAIVALAPMTESEKRDLLRLEGTVSRWRKSYRDCGKAIAEIYGRQLWREYGGWVAYCEDRLEISQSMAYELRISAEICDQLEAAGFQVLPPSQGHAVELRPLEPEQRIECWRRVLGRGRKKPTISTIQRVKAELTGTPLGVADDGTISDDLAVLMKGLSPAAQAKIVRLCETKARQTARQKDKDAAAAHPWTADLRAVKLLLARLEKKGVTEIVTEAVQQLHDLHERLERAIHRHYEHQKRVSESS